MAADSHTDKRQVIQLVQLHWVLNTAPGSLISITELASKNGEQSQDKDLFLSFFSPLQRLTPDLKDTSGSTHNHFSLILSPYLFYVIVDILSKIASLFIHETM